MIRRMDHKMVKRLRKMGLFSVKKITLRGFMQFYAEDTPLGGVQ